MREPTAEEKYIEGWRRAFLKNEYYDILSTEDCFTDPLETVEKEKDTKQSSREVK